MGLWNWLTGRQANRAAKGTVAFVNDGAPAMAAQRGSVELLRAYRTQPWLRAVASRIARSVAATEWSVYVRAQAPESKSVYGQSAPVFDMSKDRAVKDLRLTRGSFDQRAGYRKRLLENGLLRELPGHPIVDFLSSPVAPLYTGGDARFVTQLWLDLIGCAYWVVRRNQAGMPVDFMPCPPHWLTWAGSDKTGRVTVSIRDTVFQIPRTDLLCFREPDPFDPYGSSVGMAQALGDELETDEYAAKFLKSWFYNSAIPSMLIALEGATPDQIDAFRARWEERNRGTGNTHRVHVGSGKMNAQRLDSSFRDQQIMELRRFERDTVIQTFSCPPEIVGVIENSNRSTIGAAEYIFAHGVQMPRVEFLRAQLQAQLVPQFDASLCLEVEVKLPEDPQRRLDVMRAQPAAFSLNDWRAEAGYRPVPEFDGVYPPLGMPGQDLQSGAQISDPGKEEEVAVDDETRARNWALSGKDPAFVAKGLGFKLNR